VREIVRTKKQRLNPNAVEAYGFGESNSWLRAGDERRRAGMLVATNRHRCNYATVLSAVRVRVDTSMQLR